MPRHHPLGEKALVDGALLVDDPLRPATRRRCFLDFFEPVEAGGGGDTALYALRQGHLLLS